MFVNYSFTSVTKIKNQHQLPVGPVHVEHAEEEIGRRAANMERNKTTFDVRTSPTLPPLFCWKKKQKKVQR
jgi:hypothetical protein